MIKDARGKCERLNGQYAFITLLTTLYHIIHATIIQCSTEFLCSLVRHSSNHSYWCSYSIQCTILVILSIQIYVSSQSFIALLVGCYCLLFPYTCYMCDFIQKTAQCLMTAPNLLIRCQSAVAMAWVERDSSVSNSLPLSTSTHTGPDRLRLHTHTHTSDSFMMLLPVRESDSFIPIGSLYHQIQHITHAALNTIINKTVTGEFWM